MMMSTRFFILFFLIWNLLLLSIFWKYMLYRDRESSALESVSIDCSKNSKNDFDWKTPVPAYYQLSTDKVFLQDGKHTLPVRLHNTPTLYPKFLLKNLYPLYSWLLSPENTRHLVAIDGIRIFISKKARFQRDIIEFMLKAVWKRRDMRDTSSSATVSLSVVFEDRQHGLEDHPRIYFSDTNFDSGLDVPFDSGYRLFLTSIRPAPGAMYRLLAANRPLEYRSLQLQQFFNDIAEEALKSFRDDDIQASSIRKKQAIVSLHAGHRIEEGTLIQLGLALKEMGYEIRVVQFADMDFEDQVKLVRESSLMIGTFGGNLMNGVFMLPGSAVIVLFPNPAASMVWVRRWSYIVQSLDSMGVVVYEYVQKQMTEESFPFRFRPYFDAPSHDERIRYRKENIENDFDLLKPPFVASKSEIDDFFAKMEPKYIARSCNK